MLGQIFFLPREIDLDDEVSHTASGAAEAFGKSSRRIIFLGVILCDPGR